MATAEGRRRFPRGEEILRTDGTVALHAVGNANVLQASWHAGDADVAVSVVFDPILGHSAHATAFTVKDKLVRRVVNELAKATVPAAERLVALGVGATRGERLECTAPHAEQLFDLVAINPVVGSIVVAESTDE